MGVSTDGIVSFGVVCEEGVEFPWDGYDELEEWWREITGFKDVYEPFTEEGEYAEGWVKDDTRFTKYFDHRRKWLKENPLPIDSENYCSESCPMYVICVPSKGLRCWRGGPTKFKPADLIITAEEVTNLLNFLEKYNIEYTGDPGWVLLSYWEQ